MKTYSRKEKDTLKTQSRTVTENTKLKTVTMKRHLEKNLSEAEKKSSNEPINIDEVEAALNHSHAGKTPGLDGVEKTFLQRYWTFIGQTED